MLPWRIHDQGGPPIAVPFSPTNAIVGDAARRRVLLCLNQPVLGLGYRGIDAIGLAVPMIDRLCRLLPA